MIEQLKTLCEKCYGIHLGKGSPTTLHGFIELLQLADMQDYLESTQTDL